MNRFTADGASSTLTFEMRSTLHAITARATGLSGWIELSLDADGRVDESGALAGRLEVAAADITTGNRMEDLELRRQLDLVRHPTVTAVLEGASRSGADGEWRASGTVTVLGVAMRKEGTVRVEPLDDRTIRVTGRAEFDVRDFGLKPPQMGLLRVRPTATVTLELLASRPGDQPAG